MKDTSYEIFVGDSLTVMRSMDDNIFDSVVTDPPYGLEFMGKDWDYGLPGKAYWAEALRVSKPGAFLMAFGGTRTFHRLMVEIEDGGWIIRDTIMWVYGQGFPKSYNIAKGIEGKLTRGSASWNEWKKLDGKRRGGHLGYTKSQVEHGYRPEDYTGRGAAFDLEPITDLAKEWQGYGTCLKPAFEPIVVAMKPTDGSFVDNALKWGVAGLNIDACRVPTDDNYVINTWDDGSKPFGGGAGHKYTGRKETSGRWPANLMHDGSQIVMDLFPDSKSCNSPSDAKPTGSIFGGSRSQGSIYPGEDGSAARFFYCAKASKKERDAGLEDFSEEVVPTMEMRKKDQVRKSDDPRYDKRTVIKPPMKKNVHPTVKPIALMEYLCLLTMPPNGGVVLDPFMGSGTTGIACANVGRNFVGIELSEEYAEIARARIDHNRKEKKDE